MNGSAERAIRITETDQGAETNARSNAQEQRDWSASLNLVHRAGVSLREAEDQTQKLVARAQAILERANQELEAAYEGIAAAEERAQAAEERAERAEAQTKEAEGHTELSEARAKAAEARAQLAESRAKEAEEWLQRIHEAILKEFAPRNRPADGAIPNPAELLSSVEQGADVSSVRFPVEPRKLRAV